MKMLLTALACAVLTCAQDNPARERRNLAVPIDGNAQAWGASARSIERGAEYPSVIHLKGDVEIRMPVCVTTGPGTTQKCAGEIVLHADEVDLHERTGQLDARGAVRVTRR